MKLKDLAIASSLLVISIVVSLTLLSRQSLSLWSDGAIYAIMARGFYEGNLASVLHPHWQPLFPIAIALFYPLVANWHATPFVVSAFFGALFVVPFYFFVLFLTKSRLISSFSSLYAALFTPLVQASLSEYSEALFAFIVWLGLFSLWVSFVKVEKRLSFLAGVFLGLGYLTKSEGILPFVSYLVFIFGYLSYNWYLKKKDYVQKIVKKHLLLVIAGFLLIFVGHRAALTAKYGYYSPLSKYWYIHAHPGSFFSLTQDGSSTWAQDVWNPWTANPQLDLYKYPKNYEGRFKFFLELMWERTFGRAQISFKSYVLPYLGIVRTPLFLLGLVWALIYSRKKSFFAFLVVTFGLTFASLMVFAPAPGLRYLYFWLPVLPLLFGLGTQALIKLVGVKKSFFSLLILLLISSRFYINKSGISTVPLIEVYTSMSSVSAKQPSPLKLADEWLLANDPGQRIMASHEGVAVLSKSIIIYPPLVYQLEELVDYARKHNTKYLIAGENTLHSEFLFLFYEPRDYPGLKLVHKNIDFSIYEFLKE